MSGISSHTVHKGTLTSDFACIHDCIYSDVDWFLGGDNQCPVTRCYNQYLSIIVCLGVLCFPFDGISFAYSAAEIYLVRYSVVGFDLAGVGISMGHESQQYFHWAICPAET